MLAADDKELLQQGKGVAVHALMMEHDADSAGGDSILQFQEKGIEGGVGILLPAGVEVNIYGNLHQSGRCGGEGAVVSGNAKIAVFFKKRQSGGTAPVPGWRKQRQEVISHKGCKSLAAAQQVLFQMPDFPAVAELLFSSCGFVVGMAPAMLMPAEKSGGGGEALQFLPAAGGQPNGDDGKIQGHGVFLEQKHHLLERLGEYTDIVGSEKNN